MIDQTEGYTNSECSPGFEITSVSRRCSSCKNTTIGQQFCNRKRQESGHGVRLFLTSRSTNSLLSWEWESRFKTTLLHWDCYSLVPVSGRLFSWQYSGGKGKRSLLSAPSLDFLLQKCCSVFKKKKKKPTHSASAPVSHRQPVSARRRCMWCRVRRFGNVFLESSSGHL